MSFGSGNFFFICFKFFKILIVWLLGKRLWSKRTDPLVFLLFLSYWLFLLYSGRCSIPSVLSQSIYKVCCYDFFFFLFLTFKSAFVFPVFSFPFFSEWFHVLALWMQSASPLGGYSFEVVFLYHLCFLWFHVFCCLYHIRDFPHTSCLPWLSIHVWEGGTVSQLGALTEGSW